MKITSILTAGCIAFAIAQGPAFAQTKLDRNEIITSLQGAQRKVDISADDLRKQALEHIKKYPGDNSTEVLPLAAQLAQLRQFVVEITFDFDSARIRPESYETVGVMADALHTPYLMGQKFFVVGHTDAKGSREYNLKLSQARADAIREALVTTFRVPADMLEAVGLGEEQLRDPKKPNSEINRRVQLINIGF
jgi:OOP family OmpA-OmpF porin